ncbi:MAG: UDP-N-acetylmuramate--L-alanine ligase [Marinilabiliales bacterium]|nr:UDP-N-acetylmuramate--L-alanine ligase [Marinilabiliales bacterium]
MVDTNKIGWVYLLGIGGIGMSALARYFHFAGKKVWGYDKTPSPLTEELIAEGIPVHYEADVTLLPQPGQQEETLVIITPAVPAEFEELVWLKDHHFNLMKRSEVLGALSRDKRCLAIAGTHGKTSVTTMTAFLLNASHVACIAFMGGLSRNYGTNLLLPSNDSNILVAEADEFDRSFLRLFPEMAVITWMDPDHLDIYENEGNLVEAFATFTHQIASGGVLLFRKGVDIQRAWNPSIRYFSYSATSEADYQSVNIRVADGAYHFDLRHPGGVIHDIRLQYPGLMNVENMTAALALALLNGVTEEELLRAVPEFKGVERRFDIRYKGARTIYIDDYGHHPRELEATIRSVRHLYPGKKITGIFQPHLFTRTRDFADGFAASLDLLDEALVMEIYPARERPIPGVDAGLILGKMQLGSKKRCNAQDFPAILDGYQPEILLTLGAGDIDRLVNPLVDYLKKREND